MKHSTYGLTRSTQLALALASAMILTSISAQNMDSNESTEESLKTYELNPYIVRSQTTILGDALEDAFAKHGNLAGGSNIVEMDELGLRRTLTLKDALELAPGVIIQDFFGSNDLPRFFVRGSGIQSNPQKRGIEFLQDGIPLNFADGSFAISLLDVRQASFIEVFRGSNALQYGASSLGGAINIVSKKGIDLNGTEISAEAGSFGYMGGSVSHGIRSGKTDVFSIVSYNQADGYRDHNTSSRLNAQVNLLWQINKRWENGLYLTFTDAKFDVAGPLTWQQLQEDPTQVSSGMNIPVSIGPNVVRARPNRDTEMLRVANKSIYRIDADTQFSASAYYQWADDVFTFPVATGVQDDLHHDFGLSAEYSIHHSQNTFLAGARLSYGTNERSFSANINGEKGETYAENELTATNLMVYMEDAYQFSEKLTGILSFQLSKNTRDNEDVFATPEARPSWNYGRQSYLTFSSPDTSLDLDFTGFNPKAGLVYYLNGVSHLYANISRSYEPPTFDELFVRNRGTVNSGPMEVKSVKIDAQEATTLEFGTRGQNDRLSWDLSLYHTKIDGEILTTTDAFGVAGTTRNSPDTTIHQGIEFGFGTTLAENLLTTEGDRLEFKMVYNYSDFYFDEGIYQGKKIAGVPEHYVAADLTYHHPSGFNVGLNTEWVPEATPTDHRNTIYNPSYQIFGFRIAWKEENWSVFAEGKNVTDETYASSALIRDVVSSPPLPGITPANMTTFQPGTGANFIFGATFSL